MILFHNVKLRKFCLTEFWTTLFGEKKENLCMKSKRFIKMANLYPSLPLMGLQELYLLEQAPRLPNAGASLICWSFRETTMS